MTSSQWRSTRLTSAAWSAQALRDHLVASAIAGTVATPRRDSLAKYRRMAGGDLECQFGLKFRHHWTPGEVLQLMAGRCGVSPDPAHQEGPDYIDPELTIDQLRAMAARLREVASNRGTLMLGTGHPAGLLPIHSAISRRLQAAGCEVLTPAAGWRGQLTPGGGPEQGELRYIDRVAVVSMYAGLAHTHGPGPMQAMLAAMRQAGQRMPDLVMADHGFAGAAGAAGVAAVGFADCNDPALFVGEEEGLVAVAVPLDDNVQPDLYEPLTAFLLQQIDDPG